MKNYEILWITQYKVSKDNKPYIGKNGKPFVRVSIKVAEYGQEFISGLWFGPDCPWKIGDKVELIISKEMYNGKEQLKFELPKKENPNQKAFEDINSSLTIIKLGLQELLQWKRHQTGEDKPKIAGTNMDYPTPESEGIDTSDLPF